MVLEWLHEILLTIKRMVFSTLREPEYAWWNLPVATNNIGQVFLVRGVACRRSSEGEGLRGGEIGT